MSAPIAIRSLWYQKYRVCSILVLDKRKEVIQMMSRKHYKAVAEILKYTDEKQDIMLKLADMFEKDNPNFDREKFIDACLVMAV